MFEMEMGIPTQMEGDSTNPVFTAYRKDHTDVLVLTVATVTLASTQDLLLPLRS